MPVWRRCVFGCESFTALFSLPTEELTRKKWLEFIIGNSQGKVAKQVFVCSQHFTEDCFENLKIIQTGHGKKLLLKKGATPTIKDTEEEPRASSSQQHTFHQPEAAVNVQTAPALVQTRSVATQLTASSLRLHHFRSKGVQATVATKNRSTQTTQAWLKFSSTPIEPSTSGIGDRPRKRPRLEMEAEEDEEEGEDDDISDIQTCDSLYEPDSPVTSVSEPTEMESAPEFEDTKYIVFERSLKELFETCPVCKNYCNLQQRKCGTFVSFTQDCPHCLYNRKWQSQPLMGSTPLGNLQVSAAVYFSGGSFTKMERICKAMNLQIHQYDTFRRHSRLFLEPAIYHKWKEDQKLFFEDLKKKGKIVVGGDMRAYSPEHSAKFGSYTLMDLESDQVLDIQLVQSNEVDGSIHMEKEGLKRSLDLLQDNSIEVEYIVTDRHNQVQNYLQDRNVTQYYDVWHLEKDLSKKLDLLSKNKDCQVVKKWSAAIKNHMYWSASSSRTGPEKVAKWTSVINHIQNIHTHEDPLFPKCAHSDRVSKDPNKWFQAGTIALYKVEKLLANKKVLRDVAKLSSDHQTSSLEAFHNVILRFAPKNVVFSYVGLMCRLYLAGMYFNENAKREQATSKEQPLFKVTYPKSKKGQPTANPVKSKPTFGYVGELMTLVFTEVLSEPSKFVNELKTHSQAPSAQFEGLPEEDLIAGDVSGFSQGGSGTQHSGPQDLETPGGSGAPHTRE